MREIDDRYPEYARPYAPVRRGRHYGRLTGNEATLLQRERARQQLRRSLRTNTLRKYFTTGAATLIAIVILLLLPETPRTPPDSPPAPTPLVLPSPSPSPEPSPLPPSGTPAPSLEPSAPTPTLSPSPAPSPSPSPSPTPTPKPGPGPTPTPKPSPSPIPTPTPPVPLTEPEFTQLHTDHTADPGPGDPYDLFRYSFQIALHDADPEKPITLQLQAGDAGGGNWTDLSGHSLSYSGSGGEWTGQIPYDVYPVSLDGAIGILREMRLTCSYTLRDGSSGTIYSTDCGKLYSYKGEYVRAISAELKDGTVTARYQADKNLVLDLEKLTVSGCTLSSGEENWEIRDKAAISGPDSEGYYTVSYTLNGEALDPAKKNALRLSLRYQDQDGAIDWQSAASAEFDAHVAPTIGLRLGDLVEPGGYEPGFGVWAELKLNDLLGGHAVITMYKLGPGGWEPVTEFGTVEYAPGDEDEYGVFYFGYYDMELDALWGVETEGRRYKAKFVVDYTYSDGTTGTLESPVFEQYGGSFARYANVPELRYDPEQQLLIAEIIVDLSLAEPERISIIKTSAEYDCWTSLTAPTLRSAYYAGDGSYRMVFALPLETLTPGEYWCDIGLRYYNGTGPEWEVELFVICNLS